jgi:PAN domain
MRKLGLVIFGAGTYDHEPALDNPRFARSARTFKRVTPRILPNFETTSLDLYDKQFSLSETLDKIVEFIKKDNDDIVVYYCGHGDVGQREGDYRVLLRTSDRSLRYTLLEIAPLIHDIAMLAPNKRVYFVLDACYSGSATGEMEAMDAGGAEAIVDRRLSEAVINGGSGIAVFAASGRFGVALAKLEDKLTLFTGTLVSCLREGISQRSDVEQFSWLDLKDEIVRVTQSRLGAKAPLPKLSRFSEHASDITRTPFFPNRAFAPRTGDASGSWVQPDQRTSEHLYWRGISEESPAYVLEDFLKQFPDGTFSALARAFLQRKLDRFDEKGLEEYLLEHPRTTLKRQIIRRLQKLQWDRLRAGADVAGLERFIKQFPESEFIPEAQRRIDSIRAEAVSKETRTEAAAASMDQAAPEVSQEEPNDVPSVAPLASTSLLSDTTADERPWIRRLTLWPIVIAVVLFGLCLAAPIAFRSYYIAGLLVAQEDLDAAGKDVTKLQDFVSRCEATSYCTLAPEARYRLARAREAEEVLQASKAELYAARTDVATLRTFVDRCKATSCPVLPEAAERLSVAQVAAEKAAIDAKFRADLASAGNDVASLSKVVEDCKKASCALLAQASGRLAEAQGAAAREAKFRSDLVAAGNDVAKLSKVVDDCKKASCSVLPDATRRLADAQAAADAAAREAKFRNDLAAAGNDVVKLSRVVDDCRKASCAVLADASRRLADAQAAADAAAREVKFRNDLAAAGNDVVKLSRVVDDCRKASCAVLADASRRLADAQAAAEAAAREVKLRNDLALAGNDVAKLSSVVDDCKKVSCAVLQEASSRLAKAEERVRLTRTGFATQANYDMFGGDILQSDGKKYFTTDSATCQSTCLGSGECVAFTYDKWNTACYLKKSLNALKLDPHSDTGIRADQPLPSIAPDAAHFCRYVDSNLYSDNPRRVPSLSVQDCEQGCQPDDCVAYAFSRTDRLCSLFRSVSDRKKNIPNVNAGIRTQYPCNR